MRDAAEKLLAGGRAYDCYCSQQELDERNERAKPRAAALGTTVTAASCLRRRRRRSSPKAGSPSYGSACPTARSRSTTWCVARSPSAAEHVPDYVLVRANGHPLYTLVNPVDDALMEITHVLRGEDLLSSTPRQIALYDALAAVGVGNGTTPHFGHLPYVMGQGNKKLSKRDPESNLLAYRDKGFLPEGLLNYLALLGWSIAEDRDIFSMAEMVEAFTIERVNPNPARFDIKKCEAINAAHLRACRSTSFAPDGPRTCNELACWARR